MQKCIVGVLFQAYKECSSEKEAQLLLQDIVVSRFNMNTKNLLNHTTKLYG